jgi:hypothetical protein
LCKGSGRGQLQVHNKAEARSKEGLPVDAKKSAPVDKLISLMWSSSFIQAINDLLLLK